MARFLIFGKTASYVYLVIEKKACSRVDIEQGTLSQLSAELPGAGERTEVRQPILKERIDEVSIIVVLRDFRHGAIMLRLQLATF